MAIELKRPRQFLFMRFSFFKRRMVYTTIKLEHLGKKIKQKLNKLRDPPNSISDREIEKEPTSELWA